MIVTVVMDLEMTRGPQASEEEFQRALEFVLLHEEHHVSVEGDGNKLSGSRFKAKAVEFK